MKALELSIKHWERLASGKAKKFESIYSDDCALCKKFTNENMWDCGDCPVKKRTGADFCVGTPHGECARDLVIGRHSPQFKRAAKKMLTFLKSLRKDVK